MKKMRRLTIVTLFFLLTGTALPVLAETTALETVDSSRAEDTSGQDTSSSSSTIDSIDSTVTSLTSTSTSSSEEEVTTSSGTGNQDSSQTMTETTAEETKVLYRLYHPGLRTHLYTKSITEYTALGQRGWKQEGQAWQTSTKNGEDVYRLYHSGLQVHLYTKSKNEYDSLAQRGWKQEGVAFKSSGSVPVYRLYHAGNQRHLYTTSVTEYNQLASRGWKQEGIAFYALDGGAGSTSSGSTQPDQLTGTLTSQLQENGIFIQLTANESADLSQVLFAVWSEKNGQDDIKWYASSATGTVVVPYENHKGYGAYQVHAYWKVSGRVSGITSHQFTLAQPSLTGTVSQISPSSYRLTVRDVPATVQSIQIPVWSEKDGQDDLRWYTATKQSDGSYQVTVSLQDHKFNSGSYQAHIYITTKNGKETIGVGTIPNFQVAPITQNSAKVTISNVQNTGKFDVIVSDIVATGELQQVSIPVWSDANGQDDIRWYNATKQNNGTYRVTVDMANHRYDWGLYHAHAYLITKNGQKSGAGTTQANLPKPTKTTQILPSYQGTGNYRINLQGVLTSGQVRLAIWSDTNGQDDIRWYDAIRQGTTSFIGHFNAQNHSGTGKYHIHVYEVVNGQMKGIGTQTVQVARNSFVAPYFSQLDSRWSGLRYGLWAFGPTGCVPTVVAMIISSLKGATVSPVDIGNFLHYNTMEFNRNFAGTSSRGVVLAAQHWGLKATALNSVNDLSLALQQGYFVAAAVGNSKFVIGGGHEIVLKGYQNGHTYVLDPYNPSNNGWYNIQYLWSIQSTDPVDRTEGAPFIKITD
ncbi:TPA: GBS Bsp-like repeat-containing protein [Streptococcus suis]